MYRIVKQCSYNNNNNNTIQNIFPQRITTLRHRDAFAPFIK